MAACASEARAVALRAPWSFRMFVQEIVATAQYSSHLVEMLKPSSSCGACNPALGNLFGRRHVLRQVASNDESMEVIAAGERATRQCVCIILELAP